MALTKPSWVITTIQALANKVTGQATALKVNFDKAATDIKLYITDVLTVEQDTINTDVESRTSTLETADAQDVKLTGNQTVVGIKTFSSSPIVPTPTTATQASNKSYVDGVALASVADDSLIDAKLKQTGNNILPNFIEHMAHIVQDADGVHGLKIESGTFLPTITDGTNGPSACTIQSGYYQKIGTTVFFHLAVSISVKGSAMVGGAIYAGGLPFACINNATRYNSVSIGYSEKVNIGSGKTLIGNIDPGASRISLFVCPNDNTFVSLVPPAMIADGTQLFISGQYQTN